MRDFLRIAPFYMGGLALGIALALLAGVYPAVIVLGIIIVLSFTVVFMVMRVGTNDDQPLHSGPSQAVSFWERLAEKTEQKKNVTAQTVSVAAAGASVTGDDAEKERKRQEALARKAARQAKPASDA